MPPKTTTTDPVVDTTAPPTSSPPSSPLTVAADPATIDVSQLEQQSLQRRIQHLEDVQFLRDNIRIGKFAGVPHELAARNFHFAHVGYKGVARDEERARRYIERGYLRAPEGVRAIGQGYEDDGDRAIILMASEAVYRSFCQEKIISTRERIGRLTRRAEQSIEEKLRQSLPGGQDLHLSMRIGTAASLDAVTSELRAVQRDLPRR